ncbi:unnamed protein product [Rangifer tarandus platyrhynchus]|uniref:Uncharacterized protein n=2 Tax=Rangifer tarandus platyrhynchus TaxID=3082113 RepID=A0ACB0F3L6_RANTA|nr:unnamed protein product [Rangifer tarandus platyrhynchus]CAI9707693.1 unnamed protein product [Rangifer tarandus platyrhynchus]
MQGGARETWGGARETRGGAPSGQRASSFDITRQLFTSASSWALTQTYGIRSTEVGGQEFVSSNAPSCEA